jgi:tRNA A64-2'-O-ribosylphosphate transferase
MPDALSKTIPIFCAVVTEASRRKYGQLSSVASREVDRPLHPFRDVNAGSKIGLRTPLHQVSPSEHAQIDARIDGWVEQLLVSVRQLRMSSRV